VVRAERFFESVLGRMIQISVPVMMPAIFFPKGVKDFYGAVGTEFLASKRRAYFRKNSEDHRLQSAFNAIGGALIGIQCRHAFDEDIPEARIIVHFDKQRIFGELAESGVDIDHSRFL